MPVSGHLELARAARRALGLVRVDLLPAGAPWQKDLVTPAQERLEMLQLAVGTDRDTGRNHCPAGLFH